MHGPQFSVLPNIASQTNAEFFLNVWGSKDLVEEWAVGGYREEMGGYTLKGQVGADGKPTKQLINIKILGADHYNYMRDENAKDKVWNLTVSQFVTDLLIASTSRDSVEAFLRRSAFAVPPTKIGGSWVIQLPGWEKR